MLKRTKKVVTAAAITALSACLLMQGLSLPDYSNPEKEISGVGQTAAATNNTTNASIKESSVKSSQVKDNERKDESGYHIPSANDLVTVIIKLKGDGMLDFATSHGVTVPEAVTQFSAASELGKYARLQNNTKMSLGSKIVSMGYRFNTLFNGFSAKVYYRDVAAIEQNANVESVILSNTYNAPEAITENYVNVDEATGIFNSEGVGFDGTGTVVAVLDTGTDYTHEVFKMDLDEDTVAITKDKVAAVKDVLAATSMSAAAGETVTEDDLYLTSKLPYGYDYADSDANVYALESHGTHVAGIIAGKSEVITGVAPKAQIATFKVFSDYDSGAKTESLLAALNDAVALGVDAINMSLGTSCGFSREEDEDGVNEIYDKVEASGICLVVAASNDYSSGHGSTHGSNLASNPDSGTVGSPATYPASIAVASVSGVKTKYVVADDNMEIYFTESNKVGAEKPNDFVGGLLGDKTEGEYDYVVVPGIGLDVNYSNIDVNGKIAVIKRGSTNFEDKVATAQAHGAVAAVIYNNVSGTITMSVGTKNYIPSCSVSMDFGQYLVAKGSGKMKVSASYLAGPFMSDFSSWGVLPNLTLSPDITAHGGEIYSSIVGTNEYDKLSGTSMACPNLAGALILVREYVKNANKDASTTAVRDESYSRMMSTATIVKNQEGNPYSPRKQGAGIADMKHSVSTQAYLTVDGSNKPKLSLGDDPSRTGVYNMSFNIVNVSANALSYDLDAIVMTESMSSDEKTVAEKAYMFTNSKKEYSVSGAASLSGNTISVQPNGTATITVKISLADGEKSYLDANFKNGMYVEGYIQLLSRNSDKISLNIPYLAFYGDWADAPMFDVSAYEVGESAVDSSVLEEDKLVADIYGTLPLAGFDSVDENNQPIVAYWGLGAYSYNLPQGYETPVTRERYASLTTSTEGNYLIYALSAGLFRGAKTMNMEIRNSVTGELIWSKTAHNGRKAHSSGGEPTGGYVEVDFDVSKMNLANNARYTFSMECFLDWKDGTYGNRNTFSFEFSIDNESPVLTDYKVREVESGGITYHYVDFYMYDNHYMQGYHLSVDTNELDKDGDPIYESIISSVIPVYDGEYNGTTKVTFNVTPYWDKIQSYDGRLHVELFDYAKNSSQWDIQLKPENEVKIEKTRTAKDGYSIQPNGQMDLKDYIEVTTKVGEDFLEDYWYEELVWASTDPTVVEVKDGIITGLKEGFAIITVEPQTQHNYLYSCKSNACKGSKKEKILDADAVKDGKCPDCGEEVQPYVVTFNISVGGTPTTIGLTGIKLSTEAISLERGESIEVIASLEPYNFEGDINLVWTSTSANVTITVDPEDPYKATLYASKSGGATIRVSAEGSFISAYCSVSVKQEFYVDSVYLRSYTGRGDENGVVEIPDDLGIVYIYSRAFLNNDYIKKIIIPEGVQYIMHASIYGCEELTEIVLPESIKEIHAFGCAWNPKLEKINLEHVRTIKRLAFVQCPSLASVDLSRTTYIGYGAFAATTALKTVDLSKVGYVGNFAFNGSGLETLTVPANTRVGHGAFMECKKLKEVIVESDYIGDMAFYKCPALETLTFKNNVRKIGYGAFANCLSLSSVLFESSVYEIDGNAFYYDKSLTSFTVPNGLTIVGNAILEESGVTEITISKNAVLTNIMGGAFDGISGLAEFKVEEGSTNFSVEDGVLYNKDQTKLIAYPVAKTGASFTLPSTVKTIGAGAFFGVKALTAIDLGDSLEKIEDYAFGNLGSSTVAISGGANVTYIGNRVFLSYHSEEDENGETGIVFDYHTLSNLPFGDKIEYIGDFAFATCNFTGKTLTLPNSLTHLGYGAFAYNTSTTTVKFGSGLQTAGGFAFGDNEALKTINFGGLTALSDEMFAYCIALTKVTIPDTITELGEGVFYKAENLTAVTLPAGLTGIPALAFRETAISSIVLPDTVTTIGDGAFAFTKLRQIDFKNVTEIGTAAFLGSEIRSASSSLITTVGDAAFALSDIQIVNLPNATEIGVSAFEQCKDLFSVTLTNAKKIGNYAFGSCVKLQSLYLNAATEVGDGAFFGCEALVNLSLDSVRSLGANVISGTKITAVQLPACLESVDELAFNGAKSLAAINVADANEKYLSEEGVLYMRNAGRYFTLVCYPEGKEDEEYVAKSRTLMVGAYAFSGNAYLKKVTLPVHVQIIGAYAFYDMESLETLQLNSVYAPRLESYSDLVVKLDWKGDPVPEEDDDGNIVKDDNGNIVYVKVLTNFYKNFKVVFGETVDLKIIVPENMAEYDNYIWQQYVGENIEKSGVNQVSRDAIEFMDRVYVLPDLITLDDKAEIESLLILYNMLADVQKQFVQDYEGVNYYALLTKAKEDLDRILPPPPGPGPDPDDNDGLPAWAWALIGVAIAVVVAGAGVAVFFVLKKKKGAKAPAEAQDTQETKQDESAQANDGDDQKQE